MLDWGLRGRHAGRGRGGTLEACATLGLGGSGWGRLLVQWYCVEMGGGYFLFMATRTIEGRGSDPVKQFSIFAENRVGRLSDVIRLLNGHNVHVIAITILDTTDSAIIRLLVDDPDRARSLFLEHGFAFTECEVLVVEVAGEQDLKRVLSALLEAEVNIHYLYSFISRPQEKCALAISLEDGEVASQALRNRQFKVLRQDDISR